MESTDISKVLAYEIRKELADRYFGYRKIIEEDKKELENKISHYTRVKVQDICFGFVRLYILLRDEALIRAFLELIGLEEEMFYDPYLTESPTIKARVFQGIRMRGLTRGGRFKNLAFDCYDAVVKKIEDYREIYGELHESRELIVETINIFQRQNDIGSIMGFFRSLDSSDTGDLGGIPTVGFNAQLEEKMKVGHPLPLEQCMPFIPPLAPLSGIKKELGKLVDKAFKIHGNGFSI